MFFVNSFGLLIAAKYGKGTVLSEKRPIGKIEPKNNAGFKPHFN